MPDLMIGMTCPPGQVIRGPNHGIHLFFYLVARVEKGGPRIKSGVTIHT